ncbi:MAG: DoxX family protein, partial [Synechococcaceae cyanobacterium]
SPMDITSIDVLIPSPVSPGSQLALMLLRLFVGLAFIRHGWPKLRNIRSWAEALKTPAWLCFLSASSMWAGGIALIPGLLTPLSALAILI